MNNENNFPIKYAVLELKAKNYNGDDITKGYIVSKCYFVGIRTFLFPGETRETIYYKVVFPYKDYVGFLNSLRDNKKDIGKRVIPSDNSNQIDEVFKIFNTYEDAKKMAERENQLIEFDLFRLATTLRKHGPVYNKRIHKAIGETYNYLVNNFKKDLRTCYLFEKLILANTEDMIITYNMENNEQLKLQKKA